MAKIISPVWSKIRGSIAGTTYTANQFAAIVARQRVTPVNPGSQAQVAVRAAFATAVTRWNALSDENRELWDAYAQTLTYPGIGGSVTMPGRQVFISNLVKALYLQARGIILVNPADTAPSTAGFLSMQNLEVDVPSAPGTGFSIGGYFANGEDSYFVAQRSFKQSPGREYFSGPFFVSTLQGEEVTDPQSVIIDFTGLDDGGIYFVQCSLISKAAPFRISNTFILRAEASVVEP